jgi:hypothetical protein
MINKTLALYASTSVELHRKLNDTKYSGDIDAEYKAFWSKFYSIRSATDTMLRERKQINDYHTTFVVKAIVYDTVTGKEIGYQKLKFTFTTGYGLRAISGRELYDFVVDSNGDALFIYWERGELKHLRLTVPRIAIDAEGDLLKSA